MAATGQRRKPTNYGRHRNLRLGVEEENAVAALQEALSELRGGKSVPFSEALRTLLVENEKAARVMAGQPEALATAGAGTVAVPDEVWESLSDCRNRTSHSQGSLYTIMKKLNVGDAVTEQEISTAHALVKKLHAGEAVTDQEEISDAYVVMEKLNKGDAITKQQVAEAARDVKESKEAILRMEELLIEFVESERAA